MARPSIKTPCVADRYARGNERIAEVSSGQGDGQGCLIRVVAMPDGELRVEVYRVSPGVSVTVAAPDKS